MTQSVRAILICLVAYLCFDLMSIHVRYLSARYSAQELSVYRNILGILPSIVLLWYTRELSIRPADYKLVQWKLALSRGFVVAIAQLMFYTALGQLELATVSALGQTNALFVVLLAILMFREQVGFWRWGAVIIGFIGAVWIVRPGTDVFSWIALLPIGAAFCYAFAVVSLRSFDRSISNSILYLYSAFAAAIGAIFFALFTNSFSPILSITDGALILSMSICGGFGVIF
jgi:drug/metabolite transporter (DMT)-like permease